MKKIYKIIIWAAFLALLLYGFLYFPFESWISREDLWNKYLFPVIVNIVVYLIRTTILGIINSTMKGKITRFLFSITINLIWVGFIIWLVFTFDFTFGAAIISFLIVAISLTFRSRINNIVSGAMIILTEAFEVGDLIETNGIQGIVEDISLNYTQIRQFNGILNLLPNQMVFNSKITKFTYKTMPDDNEKSSEEDLGFLEKYGDKITNIISKGKKITRYIKIIEVRPNIDPDNLSNLLDVVFKKYEDLLGFRPIYYVNYTTLGRCSITLQLIGEDPKLIVLYANSFLRDVLYKLYSKEVFENWEGELPTDLMINQQQRGNQ
ncbi:MAG: mechanosensitive ion channel [Promethearchaeota archaeon]|nr:MAG: mechanosensitive ion channel [Candidatus Lokiarchaeota archaeon]